MTKIRYGVRRLDNTSTAWVVVDKWVDTKPTVAHAQTRDAARKMAREMSEIDAREREAGRQHAAA